MFILIDTKELLWFILDTTAFGVALLFFLLS